jgi:hypothetical protein
MATVNIIYTGNELRKLIIKDLEEKMQGDFNQNLLSIKVKSKQNYRSEWEEADFKAEYNGSV